MQQDDSLELVATHLTGALAGVFLASTLLAGSELPAQAGPPSTRAALALVEDGRGKRGQSLDELVRFAASVDASTRAAAVRGLGRQQDPGLLPVIYAAARDRVPSVRLEALNAVAQALTAFRTPAPEGRALMAAAVDSLVARATTASSAEKGVIARSIGRLPYPDSGLARSAEAKILAIGKSPATIETSKGVLHGLYTLARARRTLGTPSPAAITYVKERLATPGVAEAPSQVRRLALLTLSAAGAADSSVVRRALRDTDDQVRRLAVVASGSVAPSARVALLRTALRDASPIVRHEVVRAWRPLAASEGCALLIEAIGDDNPAVALAAIDGMSAQCSDKQRVADTLLSVIDANRSDSPVRAPGRAGWHTHAHALVALARTNPDRARSIVRREARDATFWPIRVYIARAAGIVGDTASLRLLAATGHGNVRETALGALVTLVGHQADDLLLAALDAPEYHVIAEGAQGLKGTPEPARAVEKLLGALNRLTQEGRENSRDPRVALLDRLDELGTASAADRLRPLTSDYDTTVARKAAALVSRWTGQTVAATPRLQAAPREDLAPLLRGEWRARVVMAKESGGGSFELRLFPQEAPLTVARFVRLARAGYFNGLTLHRVEPGFVTQGGSPAANEYMGDGPFERDELALRSHTRGTLGISTRGRDTGDAQWFVNLTDNFRLDHDYTVFAEIIRRRDVAEGILEADSIERIDVIPPSR